MFLRSLASRRKPGFVGYFAVALFGLALCMMVFARMESEQQLRDEGVRVTATIEAFERFSGGHDALRYSYSFAGVRYQVRDVVSHRMKERLDPGDPFEILVLPDAPGLPLIEHRGTAPLWAGFLIGAGFVLSGLFGMIYLLRRRTQ